MSSARGWNNGPMVAKVARGWARTWAHVGTIEQCVRLTALQDVQPSPSHIADNECSYIGQNLNHVE